MRVASLFVLSSLVRSARGFGSGGGGRMTGRGTIYLGSGSFTRKLILEEMGFQPVIRTADIDEKALGDRYASPRDLVLELAMAKADAVLAKLTHEKKEGGPLLANLLLTGDQVVVHEGRILEKPEDYEEVRKNIQGYAMSPCKTVGSAVLTDIRTGLRVAGVDTAEIHFKQIPDSVVDELCKDDFILQCAGGLMVEHELVQPYIDKMDGAQDSVMGLSKALVDRLLAEIAAKQKQPKGAR